MTYITDSIRHSMIHQLKIIIIVVVIGGERVHTHGTAGRQGGERESERGWGVEGEEGGSKCFSTVVSRSVVFVSVCMHMYVICTSSLPFVRSQDQDPSFQVGRAPHISADLYIHVAYCSVVLLCPSCPRGLPLCAYVSDVCCHSWCTPPIDRRG
jgi:hypothetical protein